MQREDLTRYLNTYLSADRFRDYCPNGLQVEGKPEINRLALGVSASASLIEQAIAWGADALLVHHGLFWSGDPQALHGWRRRRLALTLAADLNVIAYHLPLDAHLEVGNNACIARGLGLEGLTLFGQAGGQPIGLYGDLPQPALPADVVTQIATLCEHPNPLAFLSGPPSVRRVAIITGRAGKMLEDALAVGADLFLTGEPEEPSQAYAAEMGIHFVAAGHHRTETFGVRALGQHLTDAFDLTTHFFDAPNPV
jgi:dinuclear metal center YbgI/SA1388 family protein